jgi:hypothetical protein
LAATIRVRIAANDLSFRDADAAAKLSRDTPRRLESERVESKRPRESSGSNDRSSPRAFRRSARPNSECDTCRNIASQVPFRAHSGGSRQPLSTRLRSLAAAAEFAHAAQRAAATARSQRWKSSSCPHQISAKWPIEHGRAGSPASAAASAGYLLRSQTGRGSRTARRSWS